MEIARLAGMLQNDFVFLLPTISSRAEIFIMLNRNFGGVFSGPGGPKNQFLKSVAKAAA
jgi:hypothetical protein